jgi:hypothetical protein
MESVMRTLAVGFASALIIVLAGSPAAAWMHAGRWGRAEGGGGYWHATGAYGTTAYGGYNRYYGGTYATYHPPTVVNTYYGNGCYGCGGWGAAGAAAVGLGAGAVLGAATASAAGNALGTGAIYTTLPLGCVYRPVLALYQCDGTWLRASYGANGVYYRAVPPP